jgi:hypothetical protein
MLTIDTELHSTPTCIPFFPAQIKTDNSVMFLSDGLLIRGLGPQCDSHGDNTRIRILIPEKPVMEWIKKKTPDTGE